jgi:hypothetical protein
MLMLHEHRGRLPPITLTPGNAIVLGSKARARFFDQSGYSRGSRSESSVMRHITHVVHHVDVASVHCAVYVDRRGTPIVYHATEFNSATATSGTTYVNGKEIPKTHSYLRAHPDPLQLGDVLSFSSDANAPVFIVVNAHGDPHFALEHGSLASFPLLKLDESIIVSCVLPHLSLGALAKFTLTNGECARLVASHVVGKDRWGKGAEQIVEVMKEVDSRAMLLSAVCGIVSGYVDVKESTQWKLANYDHPNDGFHRWGIMADGETFQLIDEQSEQNCAAYLLLKLLPKIETRQLRQLMDALAVRMAPAQLVELLTTLKRTTNLGAVWPHGYSKNTSWDDAPAVYKDERKLRLGEDVVSYSIMRRSSSWTPEMVVSLGKVISASNSRLGEFVGCSELDIEARRTIAKLWIASGLNADEAASFLVDFFQFGDGLKYSNIVNELVDMALDESFSLSFIQKLLGLLDDQAHDDWIGEREHGYNQESMAIPSDFMRTWSSRVNFPLDFPLEQVVTMLESMSRCSFECKVYFGNLLLDWVHELLPTEGDTAAANTDKIRAISSSVM